jgi:hypothetical protein
MADPNGPYTPGSWFSQRDAEIAAQSRNVPAVVPRPVDLRWLRAKRWIRGVIFTVVALAFLGGSLADEVNGQNNPKPPLIIGVVVGVVALYQVIRAATTAVPPRQ